MRLTIPDLEKSLQRTETSVHEQHRRKVAKLKNMSSPDVDVVHVHPRTKLLGFKGNKIREKMLSALKWVEAHNDDLRNPSMRIDRRTLPRSLKFLTKAKVDELFDLGINPWLVNPNPGRRAHPGPGFPFFQQSDIKKFQKSLMYKHHLPSGVNYPMFDNRKLMSNILIFQFEGSYVIDSYLKSLFGKFRRKPKTNKVPRRSKHKRKKKKKSRKLSKEKKERIVEMLQNL